MRRCQTLSGPLPQSGSPARGVAAAATSGKCGAREAITVGCKPTNIIEDATCDGPCNVCMVTTHVKSYAYNCLTLRPIFTFNKISFVGRAGARQRLASLQTTRTVIAALNSRASYDTVPAPRAKHEVIIKLQFRVRALSVNNSWCLPCANGPSCTEFLMLPWSVLRAHGLAPKLCARLVLRAAHYIIGNFLAHRLGIGRHKTLLLFIIYHLC